jgi:antitoxin VapB
MIFLEPGCRTEEDQQSPMTLWRQYPNQLLSDQEIRKEVDEKLVRVKQFLRDERLSGVLLTQVRNVYWITAGTANNQIVLNKDIGAASVLIRQDGSRFLVCNASESGRLMEESLQKLGYELRLYHWYEANPVKDVREYVLKEIVGDARIASDVYYPGTIPLSDKFKRLRYRLTDTEIKRYRWLGRQVSEAVVEVCRTIRPGMDEYEIEALTSAALRSRGIMPTVLLIAVDDRIHRYRHALPGGARLHKYAMVNVVAEKWGMPVAVTRLVHFGPIPEELQRKLEAVMRVSARFQAATVPGNSCSQIFEECKSWYAEVGYPNEWEKHHQGGAIGYEDREYIIYPEIKEVVHERQAFAWNPTITGVKVEDTIIAFEDYIEVVTKTDDWPTVKIQFNGKIYEQPAILLR